MQKWILNIIRSEYNPKYIVAGEYNTADMFRTLRGAKAYIKRTEKAYGKTELRIYKRIKE